LFSGFCSLDFVLWIASGSYTFIDNQLNHFWNAAVFWLPEWMAPNLVTMVGTCVMVASTLIQVFYSPHLTEAAPRWVYLQAALGLFFYQTMDALDGKQARRTGSSSPLGQLFDHGCDALCSLFNVLGAAVSCRIGATWPAYVALTSVSISFYMAQWDEYHTGVMSCGNGYYGVTEGQLTLVGVHLITFVLGPEFWGLELLPSITPTVLLVGALIASNIILIWGNIVNVLRTPLSAMPADEAGNKHRGQALAMVQLIPLVVLAALGAFWISGPNADDFQAYPIVFLVAHGIGYVLFSVPYHPHPCGWASRYLLVLFLVARRA
jgi:ethanolaminephosphotransferase